MVEETLAVFGRRSGAACPGRPMSRSWMVAVPWATPAFPRSQVTVPDASATAAGGGAGGDCKWTSVGRGSLTVTFWASEGPLLVTVEGVGRTVLPAVTGSGVRALTMATSAEGSTGVWTVAELLPRVRVRGGRLHVGGVANAGGRGRLHRDVDRHRRLGAGRQ